MKKLLLPAFIAILIYSCSPKIGSVINSKQTALSDTAFVLVLQQLDSFTNDGVEIGIIKSGDNGFSVNCTYYEVIDKLKQLARQNGANVIKIIEHKSPDRRSTCERLKAKIYLVPDFRKHEKEIEWSANRKLTWEDFKGIPKPVSNPGVAAQTYCGFAFQSNYVSLLTKTKIFTKTTFTCKLSWARPDVIDRPDLLEHEQGHFDLCEVYRRLLVKKFDEKKLTIHNIRTDADIIFKEVYALYLDRQEQYDKETNHAIDQQKQMEWTTKIATELKDLDMYKN